ncbi:MAG TPA: Pls/PosA family non-ribosomal peptide synthetase [Jatrophihabitans sp.]|nr:Pls/PosA family non-ribosomal peptide synthetase [Jatrophihabitans sp.]
MTEALLRAADAPPPRTLVDIITATARQHPDATALDNGREALSYQRLLERVEQLAGRLAATGIRPGDRVGIRIASGTLDLYVAILAVLRAGAAYVPVDADDPDERAELVFSQARVRRVLSGEPTGGAATGGGGSEPRPPQPDHDAWIIFTSGSTGVPKGVAVSHRSAAAFVDAEAGLFLADRPIGPGDRVLAGLSVAFDASCEEMWLAWRNGACLVPAPRALVRSGIELGPFLVEQRITVVSTVPTLASLWQPDSLDAVRLIILGGEACPAELADRLIADDREVWNTYGPTEATVVACASRLVEDEPVRIGLPLAGWDLAVVGPDGRPVATGRTGELIIGGVGLARYLDPAKDAEKFAPLPALGWQRAYRSGDLVSFDGTGLLFAGRADEQVKLGGRRIELGEIDAALQALPGVAGAAAAVRTTKAGNQVLVGYLVPAADRLDLAALNTRLRAVLPAALVPVLATVAELPTRTSGKVDRAALVWPLPRSATDAGPAADLSGTQAWLAELWADILGARVAGPDDDFFAHGGGSLAAAQLVSALRERFPSATVADVYANPTVAALSARLDALVPEADRPERTVRPVPPATQVVQLAVNLLVTTLAGLRWLTMLAAADNIISHRYRLAWAPTVSWWWVLAGFLLFLSPAGRMALAAAGARLLLLGVRPGVYPRGGSVHVRLWAAERLAEAVDAANLAGAPWIGYYARALGARIGKQVTLHTLPPITGMLRMGRGSSVEPEVDLAGYWLDGDELHLGSIEIGAEAVVRSRSTCAPGSRIGRRAEIAAGSWVSGTVPDGQLWAGVPAAPAGHRRRSWPPQRPPRRPAWVAAYGVASALFSALPLIAALPGVWLTVVYLAGAPNLAAAGVRAAALVPLNTVLWLLFYGLLTVVFVRLLGLGLRAGFHPVRSRIGWQVWATERLLDSARSLLFPLYSSLFTPVWLRALGARIGRGVEASTVLLLPRMTEVGDGAFLADDTMIASYELGGGWLCIEPAKVGKRAFLGNSGTTAPGHRVPKNGLVAVLSAAPAKAKKGTSWLGSPPVQLRRSGAATDDELRTFAPPTRLKVARALVELCRLVPTMLTVALATGVLLALQGVIHQGGYPVAGLLSGVLLSVAGVLAGALTTAAKWLLVGRTRAVEYPLWSSFVWRNEVVDTFVEMVAAPWFARAASGTALLNLWLRSMGARIGRGAWLESYWLPEADLIRLGDGVSVNRGCVLQTHLFHDRILRMDTVELDDGASLGPHGVVLPAARLGPGASVGPVSLVMRGESVPAGSRWIGNPIAPWPAPGPIADSDEAVA